jgi:hypothetical protein
MVNIEPRIRGGCASVEDDQLGTICNELDLYGLLEITVKGLVESKNDT